MQFNAPPPLNMAQMLKQPQAPAQPMQALPLPYPDASPAAASSVPQGKIPASPAIAANPTPAAPQPAAPTAAPMSPPESTQLAAQLKVLMAPPSTKESLLDAIAKFAPTAIAGLAGGLPAAAGAAQGVNVGLAGTQAEKDKEQQSLIQRMEAAQGREQQNAQFGQTMAKDQAQMSLQERLAAATDKRDRELKQAEIDAANTRNAATIAGQDRRRPIDILSPEGQKAHLAQIVSESAIPQRPQGAQQPVAGRDVPLPLAVATQREDISRASKNPPADAGTWQLQEDANGKPILFNSKTSETKPAEGMQRSGTASKEAAAKEKEQGPANAAIGYARDYLKNGAFTGSGDEALQEKFFELAKPTTGFRMTQPQMDMLQNSRSWMGSAAAKLRHATTGTWFDDGQRREIVKTMEDLAKAKLGSGSGAASPGWTVKVVK